MGQPDTNIHFSTCTLCEAMCGIRIETKGDRVVSIRGDEKDPLSGGYICPKANALKDLHEDPDRLRHPIRRNGNTWEKLSWAEALEFTANRIHGIQEIYGKNAIGTYFGNPTVHNLVLCCLCHHFSPLWIRETDSCRHRRINCPTCLCRISCSAINSCFPYPILIIQNTC